jgi:hypothetical protein
MPEMGSRAIAIGGVASALAAVAACGRVGFATRGDGGGAAIDTSADAAADADVDQPVPPDFHSGSRLQAVIHVDPSSGVEQLYEWYDAMLDERCYIGSGYDGKTYCLPSYASVQDFADAGCSVPLGLVVASAIDATCDNRVHHARSFDSHVFALGSAFAGTIYEGSPTSCIPNPAAGFDAFMLAGEVPLSTFAAVTTPMVPHGRLAVADATTADGASQLLPRFHDRVLGVDCTPAEVDVGRWVCLPTSVVFSQLVFGDSACAVPAAIDAGPAFQPAVDDHVLIEAPALCSDNPHVYAVGSAITPAGPLYQPSDTGCAPYTPTVSDAFYAIGAEVPLATYDAFALQIDAGVGRLRASHLRDADGNGPPSTPYDTQTGGTCASEVIASADALVCAPTWPGGDNLFFSDSQCQQVALEGQPACRAALATGIYFTSATSSLETCDGIRYDITGHGSAVPVGTPLYVRDGSGACGAIDLSATPVLQSTGYIDAAGYVPMQTQIEP